ncbi:M67 family metallopeptidase [Cyanobium sp. LEGE 06143]|uniref:M67 family metallopeptidase n=1 Tax=Cyanobium sp. LEGE 06143 TaxID=945727 RepID=UPI00351CB340
MTSNAPTGLGVDPGLLTALGAILRSAAPEEGCCLLLGTRRGRGLDQLWQLQRLWPCLNVWSPPGERQRRFAIDPREQLVAQRWARQRGLQVLGAAHSHPETAAEPSPTDLALTCAPALMVILGRQGEALAWWLEEGNTLPRPLPWRMEH